MIRARYFSVVSIVLVFLIFSRITLYAAFTNTQAVSEAQAQKVEKPIIQNDKELAYDTSSPNPVLEDTSNISSFNQKKYACSSDDEGTCSEEDEELPCKACAVASGVNCGISVCTFGVAVVAMVIAALVIANSGHDNAYVH